MDDIKLENTIENIYKNLGIRIYDEFDELYANVEHEVLRTIMSSLHYIIITEFRAMNTRLPTAMCEAHFWAQNSRNLLDAIEISLSLERKLKNTKYSITIDKYYKDLMLSCREFLSISGGSSIPAKMDKVDLYYTIPIFKIESANVITKKNGSTYKLQPIGSGSYANVSKYFDEDYNEIFVLKKLKNNTSEKDLIRFKQEFELMKTNPHPNIVKVFKYFDNNSYTMEFCGVSLKKFIDKNNTKLSIEQRLDLISQLLEGIKFLHNKGLYHRDISYNNILIDSKYDKLFLKISDFGLTKDENNKITCEDSSIKGTYIDPCLEKFENYNIQNDIYALGMMINYIYFGKQNISTGSTKVHKVISKCIINDLSARYKTVDEIINDLFSNTMSEDEFYSKIDIQKLKSEITEYLSSFSANDLPSICEGLGLKFGTIDESYKSKAGYVFRRIATLTKPETVDLVLKINESMGCNIYLY